MDHKNMSHTTTKINLSTSTSIKPNLIWNVILFNCNCHTFDDVIEQLMLAIGCSSEKASQLAQVADQFGEVKVYEGSNEDCERVANIIGSIGLVVKVSQ